MNNLFLYLDYVSMNGDMYFEINHGKTQIVELELMSFPDSYTVSIKAYTEFFMLYKNEMDDAIDRLFQQLYDTIEEHMYDLFEEKPFLLLEDENIANRYAINHDLERVPRYCGFYLYHSR